MPNDATRATAEHYSMITLPELLVFPADLLDIALDRLRTINLALSPDNTGWHDDKALRAVWGALNGVIDDLEHLRKSLNDVKGGAE
ncbi:hypothetical protein [Nitratireductor sp. ZSWI3]|uniref:hypothetical protein n=1 Tax=Nitratireductor sp. ZSWI3 TaxID=2966359 RepID=UPI00214FF818|nr:hypothetical protein [Nitratireductor sp. ZSWI3]MCR4267094.1 hypothetical protein [Nitratireductor sp. ZSWI3]